MVAGNTSETSKNYQRGYKLNTEQTRHLCESISALGKSFSNATILEEREDRGETINKYANLSSIVMEKYSQIEVPDEFKETSEATKELKDITFSKYKDLYDEALDDIIESLKQINTVELVKLPVVNLEGIIRLLITICCECNNKIKRNY